MMPINSSKKNTPKATRKGAVAVVGVPVVELKVGTEASAPIIMLTMKSTMKIIGRKGTMSHPTDICESVSIRIRASRRRFSSTMLSLLAPWDGFRTVPYLSHRTHSPKPVSVSRLARYRLFILQSLNRPRSFATIECGRGLAWSMISACHIHGHGLRNADDPGDYSSME